MGDFERFHPLGGRVFVKPDEPESRTRGGIFIPERAKKPAGTGVVVAMGPGMRTKDGGRWPMPEIERGDRVVYSALDPFPRVKIDGVELLSMRDDSVLAVLEP